MKNASFTPWGKRSVFLLKNIFSATGMEEIAGLKILIVILSKTIHAIKD